METTEKILYVLIVNFVLVFVSGFIPVERIFLVFLLAVFLLGIALTILTLKAEMKGKLTFLLLVTGVSSVLFAVSLFIGALAVMGFYSYPEIIYYITVFGPLFGFIVGAVGSVWLFRKKK